MSEFTSRVDGLLTNAGISRYKFCKELMIPESTYRAWITGAIPNVNVAQKIAEYFKVTVEYLVTGNNPPESSAELILSESETDLIKKYRELSPVAQRVSAALIDTIKKEL